MATPEQYLASPKWVDKMTKNFTVLDRNKNGYLSQEDYLAWVDTLNEVLKPDPKDLEQLRDGYVKLAAALGAKPGVQLTKDQYLRGAAEFAANQEESRKLLAEMEKANFAVMDTNKDGTISLEEYTKICEASKMGAEVAKFTFDAIDKNHDGKVQLKELYAMGDRFWFDRDENVLEGISVS